MLKTNDIVYIYIADLEKSINNLGFSEDRLGKIININPVEINGQQEGIYIIKSVTNKEWKIPSYSNGFKICDVNELTIAIRYSNMDEDKKSKILEKILNM